MFSYTLSFSRLFFRIYIHSCLNVLLFLHCEVKQWSDWIEEKELKPNLFELQTLLIKNWNIAKNEPIKGNGWNYYSVMNAISPRSPNYHF